MKNKNIFKNRISVFVLAGLMIASSLGFSGCKGYSTESLFPANVRSVRVEMFDNLTFWRGMEYELSNALPKRIEAVSPYKVISNKDRADTVMSGQIVSIGQNVLVLERQTGRPLEKEIRMAAVVTWQDLKTGEMLIDNLTIEASASYTEWLNESFEYGYTLAANKLAVRIVEEMEKKW
jgi:maltodextrin utilization protein YvdJ